MSNQSSDPGFSYIESDFHDEITLTPRSVKLTTRFGIEVRRTLPHRDIRTIGAWCFMDHYGPTEEKDAMSVAAHPHVGLQTVTWLFSGEVEHRDSVGSVQIILPGELNIMTAGNGVSHSELSTDSSQDLHGLQLWTVLPEINRHRAPSFKHYQDLPVFDEGNLGVRLFVGHLFGRTSHAEVFSKLLGAEIDVAPLTEMQIKIDPAFEYGILLISGGISINSTIIPTSSLHYLPHGKSEMTISTLQGAKIVIIGGAPFGEEILMWWNFIGRTHEEIKEMQRDWNSKCARFPSFEDRIHGRIPAPPMPNVRLTSRGNSRKRYKEFGD